MSVLDDVGSFTLTDMARRQLEAYGIALAEVYRVIREPDVRLRQPDGCQRLTGHGLTILVRSREIRTIQIDGATKENAAEWAVERAEFGDSDVVAADALVARDAATLPSPYEGIPWQKRRTKPVQTRVDRSHILDRIHPALREEITRQVDGDFTRLVIHSPTRVSISPPRD